MRPIMYREVRARLRLISVLTVQMIFNSTRPAYETTCQISPVRAAKRSASFSYFGEFPEREQGWDSHLKLPLLHRSDSKRARVAAGYAQRTGPAAFTTGSSTTIEPCNMHACYHTNKFLSYKSHLAMDAKYLIMANAVTPFGPRKCDRAGPVFAAINQRG